MTKQVFLRELALRLEPLPQGEREKSLAYYDEILVDRMEDGMGEEEAVAALGDMEEIVRGVMYEQPLPMLIRARVNERKRRMTGNGLWITLSIVGAPLWVPLLVAFVCMILAVYVAIWAVILSVWAVLLALGLSCAAGILGGAALCVTRSLPLGACFVGTGLVCGAMTLFLLVPVAAMSKALIRLTGRFAYGLKSLFIVKKESETI